MGETVVVRGYTFSGKLRRARKDPDKAPVVNKFDGLDYTAHQVRESIGPCVCSERGEKHRWARSERKSASSIQNFADKF